MEVEYDFIYKLIVIGDSGVGKSSLLVRFTDDIYTPHYMPTIGVDYRFRTLDLDGKVVKLQIWDTAGQERYKTLTAAWFRGAHGAIVVYDITDADSFRHVSSWMEELSTQHQLGSAPTLLVGNKSDLAAKRQVEYATAKAFADQHGMPFLETSAKNAINVEEAFITMAMTIQERTAKEQITASQQAGGVGPGKPVTLTDGRGRRRGCCAS